MMMRYVRHFRSPVILLFLGVVIGIGAFGIAVHAADELKLNIPIGGDPSVTGLAEYIRIFYQYFIGMIGILAVAMIMFGGYKWIVASGNQQHIQSAKDTITAAVMGVILALISYILLNLINPGLTELRSPDLTVTGKGFHLDYFCENIPNATDGDCGTLFQLENGLKCYGNNCGGGRVCTREHMDDAPSCNDPEEACKKTDESYCSTTDAQLQLAGEKKMACRKVDRRGATGRDDQCQLRDILTCPVGFDRVGCNVGHGVDTVCYFNGSIAAYVRTYMNATNFAWCSHSDPRAAEDADSICCQASTNSADLATTKVHYVHCQDSADTEYSTTLDSLQKQVEVSCIHWDEPVVRGEYAEGGQSGVCDKKCWIDIQLIGRAI